MASLVKSLRFASAKYGTLAAVRTRLLTYSCWNQNRRLFSSESNPEATEKSNSATSTQAEGIILSDSCVKQLKKIAEPGHFLRLVIEGGGCSGFQYKFELDTNMNEDDRVFERDGAQIVVDTESLDFMKGSKVDFQEELIRSTFIIEGNPQAEQGCSCGSSFSIKV